MAESCVPSEVIEVIVSKDSTQKSSFFGEKLSQYKPSFINLPNYLLTYHILSFLNRDSSVALSSTSKFYRQLIFSLESSRVWNGYESNPACFSICIDYYCPLCMFNKGSRKSALCLLTNTPLKNLQIHCFITDIPTCLESIAEVGVIEQLNLKLTNKSNSPSLKQLLESSEFLMNPNISLYFNNLTSLLLDSTHLSVIKNGGRELILKVLGKKLKSLSFVGLSPAGSFDIITDRCPALTHIRFDKLPTYDDLMRYSNSNLTSLELCRANFVLPPMTHLPNLRCLRYSPSFRFEQSQIDCLLQSIPLNIRKLHIEIPSEFADVVIIGICRRLHLLESLTLEGSYEAGTISNNTFVQLGENCPHLSVFEIVSFKSMTVIGFELQAFIQLKNLTSLHTLRVMYLDSVLLFLPNLLRQHPTLTKVVLWHRKHWFDSVHWTEIETIVISVRANFPHVAITLEELQLT